MYHGPVTTMRRPSQEEDHQRQYQGQSPSHAPPYSPASRNNPSSPRHQHPLSASANRSLPPHPSPRMGTSPSPKLNGPPQPLPAYNETTPGTSTRYDPLADHRGGSSRKPSLSQTQSPTQVSQLYTKGRQIHHSQVVLMSATDERLFATLQQPPRRS